MLNACMCIFSQKSSDITDKDIKMAIAKLRPDAGTPITTTSPAVIKAPEASTFTELVPEARIDSLLKYIEGYPWTVNYYGQIANTNNTVANIDPTVPNLTQPYYLINSLILQVSSPLSSNYDQQTGITSITGNAIVPLGVIPNVGDVFLAKVDTAEDAFFIISSVSRKTHRKQTVYEVSYALYSYVKDDQVTAAAINSRINETYFFNPDTNFFNRDVLIKPSVKEATDRLKSFLHESREYYFSTFPQRLGGTITVPGINHTLYDGFLIDFLYATVDQDYLIDCRVYKHSVPNSNPTSKTLLDAILTRSKNSITSINKTAAFIRSTFLERKIRFNAPANSAIDYVLQPLSPNRSVQVNPPLPHTRDMYLDTSITPENSTPLALPVIISTTINDIVYQKEVLHPLFDEDYYIVTKHFYEYLTDNTKYSEISFIEFIIYKFLHNQAIAREDLVVTIESYQNWSLMQQMYFLPVLWLIIEANIR